MRILHIFDHSIPLHSGYTFRSRSILLEQRARGWETLQVTSPKHSAPGPMVETVEGFTFHRTSPAQGFMARLPLLHEWALVNATAQRVVEVAREMRPDILHAHSPVLNGLAALKAARQLDLPVVYEIRAFWEDAAVSHGTCREGDLKYRTIKALESHVARRADAVTVICEGLRGDLVARGIANDKITCIPNAVDIERFAGPLAPDPALQNRLGLAGKQVLGFIGSFYDYEGLDILVDAMPAMLAARDDIRLLLVGGGPRDQALRTQAAQLGLADKILFPGRVPHDEVDRYYALVDVFVYPRKAIRLTELVTPLKPLEAMAQHKLVAASDIGGHRELIRDQDTGVLFKPDDSTALAEKLLALLGRCADWPGFHARGRQFVERERSWRNSVANYENVYPKLMTRASPSD